MNKKLLILAKALYGTGLIIAGLNYPTVTMTAVLLILAIAYVAHLLLNSIHYLVWRNGRPRLLSYQRLDGVPRYVIPNDSLLGQAFLFTGQSLLLGMAGMVIFALVTHAVLLGLAQLP